jgi:hypothetical protein
MIRFAECQHRRELFERRKERLEEPMAEWNDTGWLRLAASTDRPRKISALTACGNSDAKVSMAILLPDMSLSSFRA